MILNMISTGAMIGNGKVYENLMVDVKQSNEKLITRAENIIMEATGCDREEAEKARVDSDGMVKTAIVMILLKCSKEEAEEQLKKAGGFIRRAVK
jgi:N-acetylmuramic acid 6-phosphate etherase